ncbi:thiol reductant ABC exporter subunit CydD [Azospirillum halopraeferens]|uniref:thiol reductant ABC exporter subunit CydD n=1 Tax=Azospirillum halopraeferens TaxID=34010 RepID=UPI00068441A7|nr:thiol reductant ABC exporter subunit CydD [Azospirillum halopraeferens]
MPPTGVPDPNAAVRTMHAPGPLSGALPAHRPRLALVAGCHGVAGALLIVQAWLFAGLLDGVVFGAAPPPAAHLFAVLPVLAARAGALWMAGVLAADVAIAVKGEVRRRLVEALRRSPPGGARPEGGRFAGLMVDGVEALEPFVARYLPAMVQAAMLPLAILAVVLPLDWLSALVFAVTAPLIPVFMILIGRGAERLNRAQWATLARLSAYLLDAVRALPTLRLFGAVAREGERVAAAAERYRRDTMRVLRVAFLSALALEFLATVSIALVAVFIGFRLLWGEMAYERALFILLLAPEFYLPLRTLGAQYHARMEALGAADQMAPLLETPETPGMPAPADPASAPVPAGAARGAPRVTVDAVRFGHTPGRPLLDGLSFTLEPGTLTALVGASGAGKSTVMALLRGRLAPWSGDLRIDGVPPGAAPLRPAWIPQAPHLFAGTIADTIRAGAPGAPDEAVRAAARRARAAPFIERLPDGYATRIGERGAGLSGGEVRCLALARAFLMDAPLVLLDEPSASLDPDSEEALVAALEDLRRDRTILIVAHRLTTVRTADRILVLDAGRIAQSGRFADLAGRDGPFARLAGAASPLLRRPTAGAAA